MSEQRSNRPPMMGRGPGMMGGYGFGWMGGYGGIWMLLLLVIVVAGLVAELPLGCGQQVNHLQVAAALRAGDVRPGRGDHVDKEPADGGGPGGMEADEREREQAR